MGVNFLLLLLQVSQKDKNTTTTTKIVVLQCVSGTRTTEGPTPSKEKREISVVVTEGRTGYLFRLGYSFILLDSCLYKSEDSSLKTRYFGRTFPQSSDSAGFKVC